MNDIQSVLDDMERTCAIAALVLGCDALDLYADYLEYRAASMEAEGVNNG